MAPGHSAEELEAIVRQAVHAELELVGLRAENQDARAEARADMNFLRRLRQSCDGVASKIGYAVLMLVVGSVLAIFVAGFKVHIGK
jgi:Na+-transporting NADH:ubiquinone oxidoreductase subunit NqrD